MSPATRERPHQETPRTSGDTPVPAGTFLYRRGQSTPSGTEFLSPNAHLVPARDNTHPAAQNVPGHSRTPPPGDTPHQRGHSSTGGDIPVPTGTIDAVGDRIPVPQRASCPRPRRHAPSRVECPRPFEDAPTRRHPAPAGTFQYRRGQSTPSGTVGSGGGCTTRGRGVLCLVLGLVRMCVVMRWRGWWLVSRPRRWGGFWGTGVGR